MKYRLRHLVTTTTEKVDVDPELGRVDLEDVEPGTGRLVTELASRQQRTGEGVAFRSGDVLFGKLRPYLRKTYLADGDGCCSPELVVMRPRPALVDPRFLSYIVQTEPFIAWAVASSKGVKMPRTDFEALSDYRVDVPHLDEQRRIAAELERETRDLDGLLARNARLSALVDERQQVVIDTLIIGPPGSARTETPLMFLTDPARPPMYGILMPGPSLSDGISVVDAGDVEADRLDPSLLRRTSAEIEAPYARSRLIAGDLLMSIRGSFGAVAQAPDALHGANVSRDVARIAGAPGVHSRWLLHALRSRFVFGQLAAGAMGSAVRGINIRSLKRVKVPVPSADEQADIAAVLDRATSHSTALAVELEHQRAFLNERRRCLISHRMAPLAGVAEYEGVAA